MNHDSRKDINIYLKMLLCYNLLKISLKIHAIFSHLALWNVIKDKIQYHSFLLLMADHYEVYSALEFKMSAIQTWKKIGAKFVCATVLFYKVVKSGQRGEKGLNPETVLWLWTAGTSRYQNYYIAKKQYFDKYTHFFKNQSAHFLLLWAVPLQAWVKHQRRHTNLPLKLSLSKATH